MIAPARHDPRYHADQSGEEDESDKCGNLHKVLLFPLFGALSYQCGYPVAMKNADKRYLNQDWISHE
jgi:hypothetical protein